MKPMKFKMHRDKTVASVMGLSIAFKKGELVPVPPYMFKEVIAAGGISEDELSDEEILESTSKEPADPAAREAAMFAVFEDMVLRNVREEFTAGGVPSLPVLNEKLGWVVSAKDRDLAFAKFKIGNAD